MRHIPASQIFLPGHLLQLGAHEAEDGLEHVLALRRKENPRNNSRSAVVTVRHREAHELSSRLHGIDGQRFGGADDRFEKLKTLDVANIVVEQSLMWRV